MFTISQSVPLPSACPQLTRHRDTESPRHRVTTESPPSHQDTESPPSHQDIESPPSHRVTETPSVDQSWWRQGFMAAASRTSSTAACPTPRWPWRADTGQRSTVTPAVTRRPARTAVAGTGRRHRRCRRSGGAGGGLWCRRSRLRWDWCSGP